MAILIDDRGMVWPSSAEAIARRFGRIRGWYDLGRQAVALGFIFVKYAATGTRIAVRPSFITSRSVARLAATPYARASERIALSYDGEMSSWRPVHGIRRAVALIEALRAAAQSPDPKPLLNAQPIPLDQIGAVGRGQLMPAFEAWKEGTVRSPSELYECLRRTGLLQDAIIFHRAAGSERFMIEHWGSRRDLFGPNWARIARGRDMLDQPNRQLGEWNFALATSSAAAVVPRLLACDFVVRTPEVRLVRRTNKRLLLPWRTPGGDDLLVNLHGVQRTVVLAK